MNGNENTFGSLGYIPTAVNIDLATETLNIGMPLTSSVAPDYQKANDKGIHPYMPVEGAIYNTFTSELQAQTVTTNFYYYTDPNTTPFNTNHYMVPYSYLELEGYIAGTTFGSSTPIADFIQIVFVLDINNVNVSNNPIPPTFADDLVNQSQIYNFYNAANTRLSYQGSNSSYKLYQLRLGIRPYRVGHYNFSYTFM